jgi:hypothetical protein
MKYSYRDGGRQDGEAAFDGLRPYGHTIGLSALVEAVSRQQRIQS